VSDPSLWQAKIAARLHDPAEKALILMRTSEGHEGGTSRELLRQILPDGLPDTVKAAVRRADHWASAADRAAFPKHVDDGRYPVWQKVEFHKNPVLIHPLTGSAFDLNDLGDIEPDHAKGLSLEHFRSLIHGDDLRRTALAFWRFGPEIGNRDIHNLWRMLPADTRVPDHTIWNHLDLTAAFAGAFAADPDGGPALLAVSLGPVQSFIAASQSTSDLWAGSHLLARLSWEAMRVLCEELGPESILFPRLRGIPQVDLWLRNECGLRDDLFEGCSWTKKGTDANPLFAAALPNRFTAVVPACRIREVADRITDRVRSWVLAQTEKAYQRLLQVAAIDDAVQLPGYAQIRDQLAEFPEVHWAAVPWSLAGTDENGRVDASDTRLVEAMQPFFATSPPGLLGSEGWRVLSSGVTLENGWFWKPNPGALYPAVHELLDRLLAATKSVRTFEQTSQDGWRDSITGETERLTTDRRELSARIDTLWAKVSAAKPAWAKSGTRLGALNTLKRLWPTLFVDELSSLLDEDIQRFVVSTHTMALASSLNRWLESESPMPADLVRRLGAPTQRVALPPRLMSKIHARPDCEQLKRLPGWLESMLGSENESDQGEANAAIRQMFGHKPEAYYALLLMDGDYMGAWLNADHGGKTIASSFHPQIRNAASNRFGGDPAFARYAAAPRAANPAWHMAISEALSNFSLILAPAVVERRYHGRILYAGGDDLMAMLPVNDLLPTMAALRAAFAGIDEKLVGGEEDEVFRDQLNGFVHHGGCVLQVMGERATASIGAVIAHHKTPLTLVLRELRAAEQRAKLEGGRDAFSIRVLKRSGGAVTLTEKWRRDAFESPMATLRKLSFALAGKEASRRAAYIENWAIDLPSPDEVGEDSFRTMFRQLLAYQFQRQNLSEANLHATRVTELMPTGSNAEAVRYVCDFLSVAEFLAREGRS
jgi:CRISPR-associated protein Cmr2